MLNIPATNLDSLTRVLDTLEPSKAVSHCNNIIRYHLNQIALVHALKSSYELAMTLHCKRDKINATTPEDNPNEPIWPLDDVDADVDAEYLDVEDRANAARR